MVRGLCRDRSRGVGLERGDFAVRNRDVVALERVGDFALTLLGGERGFDFGSSTILQRYVLHGQRAVVGRFRRGFAASDGERTANEKQNCRDDVPEFVFHHILLVFVFRTARQIVLVSVARDLTPYIQFLMLTIV